MNKTRIAFIGFRHGHIMSLYDLALKHPDVEVVAACEEDATTREQLAAAGKVTITHTSYADMLANVQCDAIAVGDYFGKRGQRAIQALSRNRHVISDKPICTSLDELDEIESLAQSRGLCVGCQLDMRDGGAVQETRRLVREGAIGDVQSIVITGQHPMLYGSRPDWYYQEGKHGGTINDIAIHGVDAIPWITGNAFVRVDSARVWNAALKQEPGFQDGAQFMATLDNGCGVLCDVSYLSPTRMGYRMPQYWRMVFVGSAGLLEAVPTANTITLYRIDADESEVLDTGSGTPGGYLNSFLAEMHGTGGDISPTTEEVLESSRVALQIQQAADTGRAGVALG